MVHNVAFTPLLQQVRGPIVARLWVDSAYPPAIECDGSGTNGFGGFGSAGANESGQSYETGACIC